MLAGVDINGGLSWNGWTNRGFSNQPGLYGSGGMADTELYEVYTTAFAFDATINTITDNPVQAVAPAPTGFETGQTVPTPFGPLEVSAGAFKDGNTILGIGVRATGTGSITGFKPTLRFDLDNDSYAPASATGGTVGRTSFSSFSEQGDFTVQFEGASSWRGSTISVQAGSRSGQAATYTGTNAPVLLPGGVGSGTSYDFAFRAFAQPAANAYQMFFDMTAIPRLYGNTVPAPAAKSVYGTSFPNKAGVGPIGDRVTVSLNGLGSNNVVFGADLSLPMVTVDVSPHSVEEDAAQSLTYTFTRPLPSPDPLTIAYAVAGSAAAGSDFVGLPSGTGTRTITIPANLTTASLTVSPVADAEIEPDETVVITLQPGTRYALGTSVATGTILDDDYLVDIDVDTNNDGRIGEDDDPIEDIDAGDNATMGARIFQNIDDDNRNRTMDKADGLSDIEDLDLTEASLSTSSLRAINNSPLKKDGTYRLWLGVPAGLNVFADRRRTPLTPDGTDGTWRYWNVATDGSSAFPAKVFIEGLLVGEHEMIWQLCEPNAPGQNGPAQDVRRDVVDICVEEMVFPTIDQRVANAYSQNTSQWDGFAIKEDYPWIIEKPLVDFIKAQAPVGWLETTLKQPPAPAEANAPSLDSRQAANNSSFTIEFDYEFDRSRGDGTYGWVEANGQQKLSFVANSGVKFGTGYNTEIALLAVRAMVDRMTRNGFTGLDAFDPDKGGGIVRKEENSVVFVVDFPDLTGNEREEIARLLTAVAYNRDFAGVTDAPDMPPNPADRDADDYFQVLEAMYNRAGDAAGGTLKATYTDASSSLTIWLNGQQTYNRITTLDPNFNVGKVENLQLQSHWGSGVRFKNIKISN